MGLYIIFISINTDTCRYEMNDTERDIQINRKTDMVYVRTRNWLNNSIIERYILLYGKNLRLTKNSESGTKK